ncbi:uncharacterized protein ATNIH1004_001872 [Aspergillus tanneri]|uniref:Uncharacterized protein n=1 Tax=Aspergillus tanneri TaxID=1220188 RepID=A0A5M9MEI8_9EURO|nr:uncharacterized protein ATNIH1004_001872 [Aspergillus tanneri]KAA8641407.1 hypothetical protein ATNIH1004_001872 [Aspergillus tanneri]
MVVLILASLPVPTVSIPMGTQQPCASPVWSGGVSIFNNLNTDLYVASVSITDGPVQVLTANGGQYHETWRPVVGATGISIKIAMRVEMHGILQFEYSAVPPNVYWDVSCIDLEDNTRFIEEGFAVSTSSPRCAPVTCQPGEGNCSDVYHKPTDNHAVRGCPIDTSMVMQIGL